MDYEQLLCLNAAADEKRSKLPLEVQTGFDNSFNIEYAHNSTAIDGNTLTLSQAKAIIEDGLSPADGKEPREVYEVANHAKAFAYVQKCVSEGRPLNENIVRDIHAMLMENISTGGVYRNEEVRITGAGYEPPVPDETSRQIKKFFADLPYKGGFNIIELAAWTHAEFMRMHPYMDGNGRTSRMIMNYQLLSWGFLPVSIAKENRLEYFEALEAYAVNDDLAPFAEMITGLEQRRLEECIAIAEQQEPGDSPSPGMEK